MMKVRSVRVGETVKDNNGSSSSQSTFWIPEAMTEIMLGD